MANEQVINAKLPITSHLTFEELYKEKPKLNRKEYLLTSSKEAILSVLATINHYEYKPIGKEKTHNRDMSVLIKLFNKDQIGLKEVIMKITLFSRNILNDRSGYSIFHKSTLYCAINEVMVIPENLFPGESYEPENVLKYILAQNSKLHSLLNGKDAIQSLEEDLISSESLNEYGIDINIVHEFMRSIRLSDFISCS